MHPLARGLGTEKGVDRALELGAAALDADPIDPEAARFVLAAPAEDDGKQVALAALAVKAWPQDPALVAANLRRRYMSNEGDDRKTTKDEAWALAQAFPKERDVLAFAASFLQVAQDPRADELEKALDALDAAVDAARAKTAECRKLEKDDFDRQLVQCLAALAVAPLDLELVHTTMEFYKDVVRSNATDTDWGRAVPVVYARYASLQTFDVGELIHWMDHMRQFVSPGAFTTWREQAAHPKTPYDQLEAQLALALVEASDIVNLDPRKDKFSFTGAAKTATRQCVADVQLPVARLPGSPLVRALLAIELARTNRIASVARETDRVLSRRPATFNDLWLCASAHVLGGDYETAARFAVRALSFKSIGDNQQRDFVDYPPFMEAPRHKEWDEVVAKTKGGR
jgi:hypothetical protein